MCNIFQAIFLSKEERAKLALQRRHEAVAAQKKLLAGKVFSQLKSLEEGNASSGRHDNRRQREEERERQRGESLLLKDREREVEAIKVNLTL